jgi:hypothetical protein
MRDFLRGCIVCALVLLPATVWAGHPLEVEDTYTEGKGNYLLELTDDYVKDNSFRSTKLNSIITAGAGEHTDFSLEVPYLTLNPSPVTDTYASGMGDIRLKVKHQIFENEVKQSMGYLLYTDLPTGDSDKGLGTNNVIWGFKIMEQQGCCSNIYHLNVGYEVNGRDLKSIKTGNDYTINYGLAIEHKLTESFRFLSELAGENRREEGVYSRPFTFLAGFIYDVSRSWYVDLGARAGLNKYAEDYSVRAGTGVRF